MSDEIIEAAYNAENTPHYDGVDELDAMADLARRALGE